MSISSKPISNFFLSIYQHEMANCLNNSNQISLSLAQSSNIDDALLEDIEFDRANVFLEAERLLNKMRALLHPSVVLLADKRPASSIVQEQIDSLPPHPFNIVNSASAELDLVVDLFSLLAYSAIHLLIKNERGQYDKKQDITFLNSTTGLAFEYCSEVKYSYFQKLADSMNVFTTKSKLAFEYEFLKLILQRYPITIVNTQSESGFYRTGFQFT